MWSSIIRNGLAVAAVGLVLLLCCRARTGTGGDTTVLARLAQLLGRVLAIIGGLLVCYGLYVAGGSADVRTEDLLPGVTYERFGYQDAVAHLVTIDLSNPCVSSAASSVDVDGTAEALKTITWAERESMAVAINGSFFYPYEQSKFWDVKPEEGERVTVLGPTLSGRSVATGGLVSESETDWDGQTLSITADGHASIGPTVADDASVAITGRGRLLQDGLVVALKSERYPRTVVGVDQTGMTMWWLVADGKQPGYSDGLSLEHAAELLQMRGAYDAVELDGGGSSILVARVGDDVDARVERLSRPMQIRIPGRSRAVANHLGLRTPSGGGC